MSVDASTWLRLLTVVALTWPACGSDAPDTSNSAGAGGATTSSGGATSSSGSAGSAGGGTPTSSSASSSAAEVSSTAMSSGAGGETASSSNGAGGGADTGSGGGSSGAGGAGAHLNVTCAGDSITFGVGASSGHDYPTVLGQLLGSNFTEMNFGLGGTTMLKTGDSPYWSASQFGGSTTFAASGAGDVVIMLGTNDSKPQNWTASNKAKFLGDCEALVDHYLSLASAPHVWINLPPPATDNNGFGISGTIIHGEIEPLLIQCAADKKIKTIDVYSALIGHTDLFPDGVHPNDAGAAIIAQTVHNALVSD